MYTRLDFGKDLKIKSREKQDVQEIGSWAYKIYLEEDIDDNDTEFLNILLTLNHMENGPEFALSYQRLNEIADDLISGKKNINLDY